MKKIRIMDYDPKAYTQKICRDMYIHIRNIYIYIHLHMTSICMYLDMHTHVCIYTHIQMHMHMHMHMHIRIHIRITYIHIYIYIYIYIKSMYLRRRRSPWVHYRGWAAPWASSSASASQLPSTPRCRGTQEPVGRLRVGAQSLNKSFIKECTLNHNSNP